MFGFGPLCRRCIICNLITYMKDHVILIFTIFVYWPFFKGISVLRHIAFSRVTLNLGHDQWSIEINSKSYIDFCGLWTRTLHHCDCTESDPQSFCITPVSPFGLYCMLTIAFYIYTFYMAGNMICSKNKFNLVSFSVPSILYACYGYYPSSSFQQAMMRQMCVSEV